MSAVSFILPEPTDTLEGLGVQPGWYVRHAGCSIWFVARCQPSANSNT